MTQHVMTFISRSEALTSFLRQSPQREQQAAIAMHRDMEQRLQRAQAENPDNPEGIAAGGFDMVDEAVERRLKAKHGDELKCHRGCSACCRLHVVVTAGEAKVARMFAEEVGWQIDAERAKLQAKAETFKDWQRLPIEDRACVFLTPAGECAIYAYRPMACRKYLVVSDPADCDTVAKPGHRIAMLISPDAEIAYSASMTVFEHGTMAAMLLREIEPDDASA
jgi:Fe-S-cluster containining protein